MQNIEDQTGLLVIIEVIERVGENDKKKVSMTSKYHNHILQTNPRHRDEEPRNIYIKQNICKTIIAKQSAFSSSSIWLQN